MSYSVTFVGNPNNIVNALNKESEKLSGFSKEEFDKALPHLIRLCELNSNLLQMPVLKLIANGHAYSNNGSLQYSSCQVIIENIGGQLV